MQSRHALMTEINARLLGELTHRMGRPVPPPLIMRGHDILTLYQTIAPRLEEELRKAQSAMSALQICHGDLWHDHVLFENQQVSGFVDFGAMKVESRTTDIARLLGSLARDDRDMWQQGLDAYQAILPLDTAERQLLQLFDQTTVLLSGIHWLKWLVLEQRDFGDLERIYRRLDELIERMGHLARGESASQWL
jgi:Ser/Thr protein kinase RdoA (MazF antagonist)